MCCLCSVCFTVSLSISEHWGTLALGAWWKKKKKRKKKKILTKEYIATVQHQSVVEFRSPPFFGKEGCSNPKDGRAILGGVEDSCFSCFFLSFLHSPWKLYTYVSKRVILFCFLGFVFFCMSLKELSVMICSLRCHSFDLRSFVQGLPY
jgi:hypothetical protein